MFIYIIDKRGSLICNVRLQVKTGALLQRPAGPHALLDPSGQAEHKRALPLHLAALPYPPKTHGEPDMCSDGVVDSLNGFN